MNTPDISGSFATRLRKAHGGRLSQRELAARIGSSERTLGRALAANRAGRGLLAKLSKHFPEAFPPTGPGQATPTGVTPSAVIEQASYLLGELQRLQTDLAGVPAEALTDRLEHLAACAKITAALSRMVDIDVLTMKRFLGSADWQRVAEIVFKALAPYPNPARAVAQALRQSGLVEVA